MVGLSLPWSLNFAGFLFQTGWQVRKRQLAYPNGLWDRLEAKFVFTRLYEYYLIQVPLVPPLFALFWLSSLFQAYFPTFLTVCVSWTVFFLETR